MPSTPHAASSLRVLFATPECAPLVKTGGLGDVSASLPPALRMLGVDARVLLPGYPAVLAAARNAPELARFVVLGHEVRLIESTLPTGVPLLVLDCPTLFDRDGGPYQTAAGTDWDDNALRFGVLSRAAAILGCADSPWSWRPDVVHCHDWPTALAPVYLSFMTGQRAPSLVTIHNLAFQGVFDRARLTGLELPPASMSMDGLEYYGRFSFLKGGLVYADALNTVSPTYAREIQGEALGFGMDGVLRYRSDRLYGVLNGIDTALWDPRSDPLIPARYGPEALERKRENALALRRRMALIDRDDAPLMAMVSRLTHQKGIDLILDAAEELLAMPVQLALVGTGDHELEGGLRGLQHRHPGQVGVYIGFDEALAHLVEAGADMFLMPSRFEPCGMNQMYSQRYGTPPIATATGGLVDTVFDEERAAVVPGAPRAHPTGFLMKAATMADLVETAGRAVLAWRNPEHWRALQRSGMARDFGWDKAAREYLAIYQQLDSRGQST